MKVTTQRNAPWLQWITPERFNDKDLFRIVTFFVFHSPCKNLSSMGKPLSKYGWSAPWQKPYYLNRQLKQLASNYELLFSAASYEKMDEALEKADLLNDFPSNLEEERICIYDKEKNQFMSVFYHLRNSFAHGRLNMVDVDNECVFVFEDVAPNSKSDNLKVSARMVLKKSTLLSWIDIIEHGESKYKKQA